eukprot:6481485-Amphidinium_carterae.1
MVSYCDRKKNSRKFLIQNTVAGHIFEDIDDLKKGVVSGSRAGCSWISMRAVLAPAHFETRIGKARARNLIVPLECAPSSHQCLVFVVVPLLTLIWQRHPETKTLFSVLGFIRCSGALGGVLENVRGLATATGKAEKAPLDVVKDSLQDDGFAVEVVQMGMEIHHAVCRDRLHFESHLKGGSPNPCFPTHGFARTCPVFACLPARLYLMFYKEHLDGKRRVGEAVALLQKTHDLIASSTSPVAIKDLIWASGSPELQSALDEMHQ